MCAACLCDDYAAGMDKGEKSRKSGTAATTMEIHEALLFGYDQAYRWREVDAV